MENGEQKTLNGVILVDKPAGWTSHDVVAKVRNSLRQGYSSKLIVDSKKSKELKTTNSKLQTPLPKVKVGHTGTLDPFATGLLILVVGSYTKRASEFSGMDKTYEAEMTFGATSTTGDPEGDITQLPTSNYQLPSQSDVEAVFRQFEGPQMQMPHKFSAKKIQGQKAYDLARAGKEMKLEPKRVEVYSLELIDYSYPSVKFAATVSSGTYIRSLAEDIGAKLGTGAYLSALRRTSVGKYSVKDAQQIDKLSLSDIISL